MIENQDGHRFANAVRDRIIATVFLIVVCCGTLFAAAESSYTVNVVADGQTIMVKTSEKDANAIIDQAGLSVGDKDKTDLTAFVVGTDAKEGNTIKILRAKTVKIVDDGEEVANFEIAGNVADALLEAGVTVREADAMNYTAGTPLENDMTIEIKRAFTVDVTADGKTQDVSFVEGTVRDVLDELKIELGENDEVSPSLDTALKPGKSVTVYRVTYEERTVTETIKFKTVTKSSASLYKGTTKVEQDGKNGSKEVVYKDKIVDGKVSKSIKVSQNITENAVDRIVLEGTKIKILTTSGPISSLSLPSHYNLEDGIPTSALTTITGKSTAYTANSGSGTASGAAARSGYVAVNPNQIPYGTEMYVVSTDGKYVYGYCIAADTGGFAKRGSAVIDLFMDTKSECYQWGSRQVCIYILNWGNGNV